MSSFLTVTLHDCTTRLDRGTTQTLVCPYTPGQTIAQAVYLSGCVSPAALCSGIKHCGQCRVRFIGESPDRPDPGEADRQVFSAEQLAAGWRLGCRHPAKNGMVVAVPAQIAARRQCSVSADSQGKPRSSEPEASFLGIDLGTTSVQAVAVTQSGAVLWRSSVLNPQIGAGSDVVSRLGFAAQAGGAEQLRRLTRDCVRGFIDRQSSTLAGACLAANPAMTLLFLGEPLTGLVEAPYALAYKGGRLENVEGTPVWIPPQLAPFVGGDSSAGYAALLEQHTQDKLKFPFLLADMGTNGEFVLALDAGSALVTSVALGPALEGIGLRCGTLAQPGAVTGFTLTAAGLQPVFYDGHDRNEEGITPVQGMTATAYLQLSALLRRANVLQADGRFTPDQSPLFKKYFSFRGTPCRCRRCRNNEGRMPPPADEPVCMLPHNLFLSAGDIEEILKVKAAFSLGLSRLLQAAGLASHDLSAFFIAGALGDNVDINALEVLGFFPPGSGSRIVPSGNTSLQGAALLARDTAARERLIAWSAGVQSLDLAADAAFLTSFCKHMRFQWVG